MTISLPKHNPSVINPFHDVTEGPVHILLMVNNEDSASIRRFATSDNDLFLSTFVDYSTDSYSSVDHGNSDTFLVLAGQGIPVPFNLKFRQ